MKKVGDFLIVQDAQTFKVLMEEVNIQRRKNPKKNKIEFTELGTLVYLNNQKYLRIDQNKVLAENNKALK